MTDPETLVRRFLGEHVLTAAELAKVGRDDHLLRTGVLNSLTLTHLIVSLEEDLGIRVPPSEFNPENFQSIRSICELVHRVRQSVAGSPAAT
jgi:acyl carrier protein